MHLAACPVLLVACLGVFEIEQQGVRVRVDVYSNRYDWQITNLSADPIRGFRISTHHTYNHAAPEGWQMPDPMPAGHFSATAGDANSALRPGQSAMFTTRVNSRGAILGVGDLQLELSNGDTLIVPGVWRPIPESRSLIKTCALTIVALAAFHVALGEWRARKRQRST